MFRIKLTSEELFSFFRVDFVLEILREFVVEVSRTHVSAKYMLI